MKEKKSGGEGEVGEKKKGNGGRFSEIKWWN